MANCISCNGCGKCSRSGSRMSYESSMSPVQRSYLGQDDSSYKLPTKDFTFHGGYLDSKLQYMNLERPGKKSLNYSNAA